MEIGQQLIYTLLLLSPVISAMFQVVAQWPLGQHCSLSVTSCGFWRTPEGFVKWLSRSRLLLSAEDVARTRESAWLARLSRCAACPRKKTWGW